MSVNNLNQNLTPGAIKKAVVSTTLQKPLTIYPATVGMLGGFYALVFGANPIALGALAAGGGVTVLNWMYEYFVKGDDHANKYVTFFRKELEQRRISALKHLERELNSINNDQAAAQIKLFRNKYDNFHSILDRKLDPTEITYNRYLSIAEQVFLNGLDNLENAAISLKSISTIDRGRIASDMEKIGDDQSPASQQILSELRTRLALKDEQIKRVNDLLLMNEKALTQLDHVATKLANIDTKQNRAHVDMEEAMDELKRLISKTDDYSN